MTTTLKLDEESTEATLVALIDPPSLKSFGRLSIIIQTPDCPADTYKRLMPNRTELDNKSFIWKKMPERPDEIVGYVQDLTKFEIRFTLEPRAQPHAGWLGTKFLERLKNLPPSLQFSAEFLKKTQPIDNDGLLWLGDPRKIYDVFTRVRLKS